MTSLSSSGKGGSTWAAAYEAWSCVKNLGSVTLKRVSLFCSPTKHSTHTQRHGQFGSVTCILPIVIKTLAVLGFPS